MMCSNDKSRVDHNTSQTIKLINAIILTLKTCLQFKIHRENFKLFCLLSCTQLDKKVTNYIVRPTKSYPSKLTHRYTQLDHGQHLQSRVKPLQRLGPQRPRRLNIVQVQHLVMAYHRARHDRVKKKQSLVKEDQQHLKGQHQQSRVELHQRLDPQRLRCIPRAHVHLLDELQTSRSLFRLKLSQFRAAHLSNTKTNITFFFYRIFITSSVRIKSSSSLTPSPTPVTSNPTPPSRSTKAPMPSHTTRTSSSSSLPSPSLYPKILSP